MLQQNLIICMHKHGFLKLTLGTFIRQRNFSKCKQDIQLSWLPAKIAPAFHLKASGQLYFIYVFFSFFHFSNGSFPSQLLQTWMNVRMAHTIVMALGFLFVQTTMAPMDVAVYKETFWVQEQQMTHA